ncbi:MAG: phosphatase PAP2 family protein [Bacteroidota bacterium]
MKNVLKRLLPFLLPYIIVMAIIGWLLLSTEKTPFHRVINQFNAPFSDEFFKLYTHAGDFVFSVVIILLLAFIQLRYAIMLAIATVSSSLFAQFLKRLVFPDADRPIKHLYDFPGDFHFVDGIRLMWNHSFPSGHTVSAFAACLCLAFIVRKMGWQWLCLFAALLVSYSRIYLSQHYLEDVYFGSLIGVSFGLLAVFIMQKWNKPWMDKPLHRLKS